MLAENALRRFVAPRTLSRGDAYYAQGRVRRIERLSPQLIHADVQGSRVYSVELMIDGDSLTAECECPWFHENLEECKHIWAVIRAASARKMLPERPMFLGDNEGDEFGFDGDEYDDDEPPVTYPRAVPHREAPPAWQSFLNALPPPPPVRDNGSRSVPEEVAYVIAGGRRAQTLTLEILGRSRKKNGDWGKWKPLSIRFDELPRLPEFDRETLALLNPNSWSHTTERMVTVSSTMVPWWVERLARAGKLSMLDRDEEVQAITWDDGPPFTLHVAIVNDAAASKYRIVATIERDGETLPLDKVEQSLPGIVIAGKLASRFDDAGRGSWLEAVSANPSIEIPHADADRFRQALLRAPIANIELPEELGWTITDIRPRPMLSLTNQSWTSELSAQLDFVYD